MADGTTGDDWQDYTPKKVRQALSHFQCDLRAGGLPGECVPNPFKVRGRRQSADPTFVLSAAIVADLKRAMAGLDHEERLGVAYLVARGPVDAHGRGALATKHYLERILHRRKAILQRLATQAVEKMAAALGWIRPVDDDVEYVSRHDDQGGEYTVNGLAPGRMATPLRHSMDAAANAPRTFEPGGLFSPAVTAYLA